ncbi:hypothetical protein [Bacillus sp. FDAARGOS_235]|uniref:hypothetical protein n=1 Tax=Bacillus sp. FDAARGOS_235 TaxID=1839798 RepID=UPI0011A242AD|nr:hypothetical protein [Bacillus sp. FDAARGOS_235]
MNWKWKVVESNTNFNFYIKVVRREWEDLILDIGIIEIEKSNEFLKSLWAEMKKEFGKCAWQYNPYKIKQENTINFGFMDIDVAVLNVKVTYKQKGSIIKIIFEYPKGEEELEQSSPLGRRLKKVVRLARRNIGRKEEYVAGLEIKSYFPLLAYEGKHVTIKAFSSDFNKNNKIYFPFSAYDENQADGQVFQKMNEILDFLSVETNAPFWEDGTDSYYDYIDIPNNEIYQDTSFIDGLSLKNEFLSISQTGMRFLDYIVTDNGDDKDLALFLSACYHFHTARKYDAQIHDFGGNKYYSSDDGSMLEIERCKKDKGLEPGYVLGNSQIEIATTLYLSALEVITLIGFEEKKCKECGQDVYQISSRVKGIAKKYFDSYTAEEFTAMYNKRSNYLHRGYMLTDKAPTTSSVPLLDVESESGCIYPENNLQWLREHTSYILRAFYREQFMK